MYFRLFFKKNHNIYVIDNLKFCVSQFSQAEKLQLFERHLNFMSFV